MNLFITRLYKIKQLFILLFISLSISSCNNGKEKKGLFVEENQVTTKLDTTPQLEVGCYTYNDDKNYITFEITETEDRVIGNLMYKLDGKDANTGVFKGKLNGNILFGNYTFNSEGLTSTREVTFQLINNKLIEGFGMMNDLGNSFIDKNDIAYTSQMQLTKTTCKD